MNYLEALEQKRYMVDQKLDSCQFPGVLNFASSFLFLLTVKDSFAQVAMESSFDSLGSEIECDRKFHMTKSNFIETVG